MINPEDIEVWWKRIGCVRQPSFSTGEQGAMAEEIKELRQALQGHAELLKKYMKWVSDMSGDGIDFVSGMTHADTEDRFTYEEWKTLCAIANEVYHG